MKKIILTIFVCALTFAYMNNIANAAQNRNTMPKNVVQGINMYRSYNYVGAIQELEDVLRTDKNNSYAKYYLALAHTSLGHKSEAQKYYKDVVNLNQNKALVTYSKQALACLSNPSSDGCAQASSYNKPKQNNSTPVDETLKKRMEDTSDIGVFINSGERIHPAAKDAITRERMQRSLEKSEKERKNQNVSLNNPPTNEEIMSALDVLNRAGINPYQVNPYQMLSGNYQTNLYANPMLGTLFQNNAINNNSDAVKMLMYSQMFGSQNGMGGALNYGF